ncbi:MAG: hypothetical protein ACREO8_10480 [Luteimonas sp.]
MLRLIAAIALTVLPCLAAANTGVALVHGTGRQTDAFNGYWTAPFVESVRRGLPDPANVVVVNCDFTQFITDSRASGCLAGQLSEFIARRGITDLVIVAHSHGGNMVRWIFSNPTFDSRYPGIINVTRRINALAPSSAGTPLADAAIAGNSFEQFVGELVNQRSNAVREQQVATMANINATRLYGTPGRPALPRPFRSVLGTNVNATPFSPGATCGGFAQSAGLKFTQTFLTVGCSDGFLECSSQSAAGSIWFRDNQRTVDGRVLSHHQSRRDCFGLDVILRDDI